MKIQNNNISFQQRYKTGAILQVTSYRVFEPEGFNGIIDTVKSLYGEMPKYLGSGGYKKYAQILSEKIINKYPQVDEATKAINAILEEKPNLSPKELHNEVQPIISKIGKEIDITI